MLNVHSMNMNMLFVILLSTLSTVVYACNDHKSGIVYTSKDSEAVVYREFPENYSVRPYCPTGKQVTEILMMPYCGKNVSLYPLPNCGKSFLN